MTSTAQQVRNYSGPAILSYGFRPFFLAGSIWAALTLLLWLPLLTGKLELPTAFAPVEWHVHELIYGYVPAIIAGFLLTAVPNWTGRLPVTGTPLLMLFLTWVAGRIAIFISAWIGPLAATVIDLLFLVALTGIIAREILAAKNKNNLKVLGVVLLLLSGNAIFHVEAMWAAGADYGTRLGIAAIIFLIMLIGGRIIPSFTRNWLVRKDPGFLPVPFGRFDMIVLLISGGALATWIALSNHTAVGVLAILAGVANTWRLLRWAGWRTISEPLVLVLHLGYAFIPIGFFLQALSIANPDIITQTGALHAWTSGGIGLMTLAVMTRASLGHVGRPLTATFSITLIYFSIIISALARIIAALSIAQDTLLHASMIAWVLAFLGFAIVFGPLLIRPRQ